MKASGLQVLFCALLVLPLGAKEKGGTGKPTFWHGVHVMTTNRNQLRELTKTVDSLADLGVNVLVAEINYGYAWKSHPELQSGNPSRREDVKALVAACRRRGIRLIPQFQCLGHQSWSKTIFPLLSRYPQLDETPGLYPENKGIYCRSWCPLHPEVNKVVFALMDELIEVFEADALHVGMDEVFLIGEDACPRCRGKDKGELFARAVNDYHRHLVKERKVEMLMWGDRLLEAGKMKYSKWEASANGTATAIDRIPRDIILCDWHYGRRDTYPSVGYFLEKGFRVWPASWKKPEATEALVRYSLEREHPRMLGHLNTTWGAVPIRELAGFKPLQRTAELLKEAEKARRGGT